VVESELKSVQELKGVLQDTIKSAPGGIKPEKDIAASVSSSATHQAIGMGIATHIYGCKPDKETKLGVDTAAAEDDATHQAIGKVIADGNKAITSEEITPPTDTATYISNGKDQETDTAKILEGGKIKNRSPACQ
jgi:hypothetical protein